MALAVPRRAPAGLKGAVHRPPFGLARAEDVRRSVCRSSGIPLRPFDPSFFLSLLSRFHFLKRFPLAPFWARRLETKVALSGPLRGVLRSALWGVSVRFIRKRRKKNGKEKKSTKLIYNKENARKNKHYQESSVCIAPFACAPHPLPSPPTSARR